MKKTKIKASKSQYDSLRLCFEVIEFKSETANFITLKNGNRNAKETGYYKLFDTFEDARKFVITEHAKKIIALRAEMEKLQKRINEINEMGFCCPNCNELCLTEEIAEKHCLENIF